jgi:DNA sulfur modification protein DndB
MLLNIDETSKLSSLAREKSKDYDFKTIKQQLLEEELSNGWEIFKKYNKTIRMRREKSHSIKLEDRVWTLLYNLRFKHISTPREAILIINSKDSDSPKTRIDTVGIDDEIAIAIECKSQEKLSKRSTFQEELGKFALIRQNFANAIANKFPSEPKRQVILAMFLSNVILSENDKERAKNSKVLIFDHEDLEYYWKLIKHSGWQIAKYQFFADMLPGKTIPGLEIRVPSIKIKIGGNNCYAFCMSPEYLLKIAYVSHHNKAMASSIETYQRLVKKKRLDKIREYISDGGVFPTNIIINLEKNKVDFHRQHQETDEQIDQDKGLIGWLDIRPAYKSAWIIDGQHRLYAYSGHERASKDYLPVLAFEGLPPVKQADLFATINSKQRPVPESLLNYIYSALHLDSEDEQERIIAIISKAFQQLNEDQGSALFNRIMPSDTSKDEMRCISLTSLCTAASRPGFYIRKTQHGKGLIYGTLWQNNNEDTLKRSKYILGNWLNSIRDVAKEWWDKGAGEGGGLAMNAGIMALIRVLDSIFTDMETKGIKTIQMLDKELWEYINKYAVVLGEFLISMNEGERKYFRKLGGEYGVKERVSMCQESIHNKYPDYNPPGLDKFIEEKKADTRSKAKGIIEIIELKLQNLVFGQLREMFGDLETQWWVEGVPSEIRATAGNEWEKDDRHREGPWCYLNLIDYRRIALKHWKDFQNLLAYGTKGNKEDRTTWIKEINDLRNGLFHPTSKVSISLEQLAKLQEYVDWLGEKEIELTTNDDEQSLLVDSTTDEAISTD